MRKTQSIGSSPTSASRAIFIVNGPPDAATRRTYPKIARVTPNGGGFRSARASMDDPRTVMAANAIRALDQRLVQMPTIGGSLPFSTFSDALKMPTIGLAVVNFDNNQHAVEREPARRPPLGGDRHLRGVDDDAEVTTGRQAYCVANARSIVLDHVDGPPVFVERQVLVRRVIERAVAGAVGDDRAAARPAPTTFMSLVPVLRTKPSCAAASTGADRRQEAADQRVVAIAAPRPSRSRGSVKSNVVLLAGWPVRRRPGAQARP